MKRRENGKNKLKTGIIIIIIVNLIIIGKTGYYLFNPVYIVVMMIQTLAAFILIMNYGESKRKNSTFDMKKYYLTTIITGLILIVLFRMIIVVMQVAAEENQDLYYLYELSRPFSYSNIQSDLLNNISLFIALAVMFLLSIKSGNKTQEEYKIFNNTDRYRINSIINERTTNKYTAQLSGIKAGFIILICNKAADLLLDYVYTL